MTPELGPQPEPAAATAGGNWRGFLDEVAAKNIRLHSVKMVRDDKTIFAAWWSPYRPEHKHTLYSLTKSFTSTLVGMAIGDGKARA